jgi:hypothetical protein
MTSTKVIKSSQIYELFSINNPGQRAGQSISNLLLPKRPALLSSCPTKFYSTIISAKIFPVFLL